MSKRVSRFSGWVLGLLVVGALAFGLSVATARPATAMTCQNDGWNFVGSQPNAGACQTACNNAHPGDPNVVGHWNSTSTCCSCLF